VASDDLTIELKGVKELLTKMALMREMRPLRDLLTKAGLLGQRTAREGAPHDTRTLARSIALDVQPFAARVYTPLNYAPVMEYGRRAGAKMPPPHVLSGWARRHGIPQSALFVIARAIGRRGIKGRFFMAKAKQTVEAALPSMLNEMARKLEAIWAGGKR